MPAITASCAKGAKPAVPESRSSADRRRSPAGSSVEAAAPGSFCAELWHDVGAPGGVFSAVMAHPFLTSLSDGSLKEEVFKGYVVQGCLYLREYARALAVLAGKAPRPAWTAFLGSCVQEAVNEEPAFHQDFLASLGSSVEQETAGTTLSPYSQLYSSFILATVHERSFAEGLAAILPCFLLYLEMGKSLLAKGSPHSLYQRFIDRFSGSEYEELTLKVVGIMNAAAEELGEAQRQRVRAIFLQCCRMELLFFEGAYAQQRWPV